MPVQTPHRFNVAEYYRMAETDVLPPDAKVELLDGRILDISPIGPIHGGIVKRLSRLLTLGAKGRWIVSTQDPVHLDEHSEPEPDVMLRLALSLCSFQLLCFWLLSVVRVERVAAAY